jgi:Fic family protein
MPALVDAKSALNSLTTTPYQREWVQELQKIQLKMEVAGTSRIEGAEFTEGELDAALKPNATADELFTRSQRQAKSAVETYRWISHLPNDFPITSDLIRDVHRSIVVGCDDDHCPPGTLRRLDENVTFGVPRHRGCEGGHACQEALDQLVKALHREYQEHDPLIRALALHYHFAAMHPFLDGNGRTARALEALLLQRCGLKDTVFIAMSNYYYDEKSRYLQTLSSVEAPSHDLTEFLIFGLQGIARQCERLFREIKKHMQRALFRNMMYDLFNRLQSTRKRLIQDRQIELLKLLLPIEGMDWFKFTTVSLKYYEGLNSPTKALRRDVLGLMNLGAIRIEKVAENQWNVLVRLEWPSEITESEFFEKIKHMPRGKTFPFLP